MMRGAGEGVVIAERRSLGTAPDARCAAPSNAAAPPGLWPPPRIFSLPRSAWRLSTPRKTANMMTSLGSGSMPAGVAKPGSASERMRFSELKFLLRCDLYRYEGREGLRALLQTLRSNPG